MSLLRQRAIVRSAVSSRRVRRPPEARAWFCSEISCDSEPELKALTSQPRAIGANASPADEEIAIASATTTANRRDDVRDRSAGRARVGRDIRCRHARNGPGWEPDIGPIVRARARPG